MNVFFILPPICNCSGVVVPLAGDADLFLSANGPRNPVIAASTRGVGMIDLVSFGPPICWPWLEFVPWFSCQRLLNVRNQLRYERVRGIPLMVLALEES